MDKHIAEAGFTNMSEGNKKYIGEYKSTDLDGNAIDVSKRISWEFTEDAAHNAQYIDQKVIDNIYDMDYIFTLAGEKGARAGGKFEPIPLVTGSRVRETLFISSHQLKVILRSYRNCWNFCSFCSIQTSRLLCSHS